MSSSLSGGAQQEQSVRQCVLRGWEGVRREWEGRAQLPVHRGENLQTAEEVFVLFFIVQPLIFFFIHQSCKPHKRSVCGSNGKTYRNHCELHRDACLTGLKIQVDHDGHCQGTSGGKKYLYIYLLYSLCLFFTLCFRLQLVLETHFCSFKWGLNYHNCQLQNHCLVFGNVE